MEGSLSRCRCCHERSMASQRLIVHGLHALSRPFAICCIEWMLHLGAMISLYMSRYILLERGLLTTRSSSSGHTMKASNHLKPRFQMHNKWRLSDFKHTG